MLLMPTYHGNVLSACLQLQSSPPSKLVIKSLQMFRLTKHGLCSLYLTCLHHSGSEYGDHQLYRQKATVLIIISTDNDMTETRNHSSTMRANRISFNDHQMSARGGDP